MIVAICLLTLVYYSICIIQKPVNTFRNSDAITNFMAKPSFITKLFQGLNWLKFTQNLKNEMYMLSIQMRRRIHILYSLVHIAYVFSSFNLHSLTKSVSHTKNLNNYFIKAWRSNYLILSLHQTEIKVIQCLSNWHYVML